MSRSRSRLLAAGLLCLALAGCSDRSATRAAPPQDAPEAAEPVSRALVVMPVPITVDPPDGFPIEDRKPGLTTWRASDDAEDAIRIMTPLLLRPADGADRRAPADFHAHLVALERQGARISDDRTITVGGVSGHLFTVATTEPLGTALGCWADLLDTCFGLSPRLRLRMATFTVDGRPVLLWARTTIAHPSASVVAAFERMLPTVRFSR